MKFWKHPKYKNETFTSEYTYLVYSFKRKLILTSGKRKFVFDSWQSAQKQGWYIETSE